MGSQSPMLAAAALYLLGMLDTYCFGQSSWQNPGISVNLTGSPSPCQGQLEVHFRGLWYSVCSQSWGKGPDGWRDAWQLQSVCQQLHCGNALAAGFFPAFNRAQNQILCHGPLWSFDSCNRSSSSSSSSSWARLCHPLGLVCVEPKKTTPRPTSPPPTTTPQPTAPPRLRLVPGSRGLRCAGVVEFYRGSLGGTISAETQDQAKNLGTLVCSTLQCGALKEVIQGAQDAGEPGGLRPLPIRWAIQNTNCTSLEQCFRRIQPWDSHRALAVVCSGFQPKVQSRLVGGSGTCEGTVEVRQRTQWAALCHSAPAKSVARWEELCQEQQCGRLSSYHLLDTGKKTASGFFCDREKLSQCHELQEKKSNCKRVFVTCQDPNPAGPAAGSVASIVLALVLLAVLLVVCGPHAYRKLVKKFRQKKQRQWIGPTEMNQNMSFHRNHTATVRSQVGNPAASSHVDNEYSQPLRNSCLSAYPALEGALHRSSAQPDNSSDSDYDLHAVQRL